MSEETESKRELATTEDEKTDVVKEEEEELLPLRKEFELSKKIKIIKLILALVINFFVGGTMFVMAIFYLATMWGTSSYLNVFSILLLIFGGVLFVQFPFLIARTFGSRLKFGKKTIAFKNSFSWKSVKWDDLQEVMVRVKLKRENQIEKELVGVDLIRFRTVTQAIHFLGENYSTDASEEMLVSIKESFEEFLEGSDYKVRIESERPSAIIGMYYFTKESEKDLF